jgi:hypothetical protein
MQEEVPFPEQKSKHKAKPQLVFNRPPVVRPPNCVASASQQELVVQAL